MTPAQEAVLAHVRATLAGHDVGVRDFAEGPMPNRLPGFRVACASRGPVVDLWSYVSLGAWDAVHEDGHGLEFLLHAPEDAAEHVLHLAMTAFYHANPEDETFRLDHGHTVPIGEPWLPGSACDRFLVGLPYILGSDFEICEWDDGHARILWLVPITEAESRFRHEHGLEALEQKFDAAPLRYWDPGRDSVV